MNQVIIRELKEGKRDKNTEIRQRETMGPCKAYDLNEHLTNELNIQSGHAKSMVIRKQPNECIRKGVDARAYNQRIHISRHDKLQINDNRII